MLGAESAGNAMLTCGGWCASCVGGCVHGGGWGAEERAASKKWPYVSSSLFFCRLISSQKVKSPIVLELVCKPASKRGSTNRLGARLEPIKKSRWN